MDKTPNLLLPYIAAAQSQKHVTHNEAIRALDAIVHLSVGDRTQTIPPASPSDGARHIVAQSSTGAWASHDDEIAAFQDGAWLFYAPRVGWTVWVESEDKLMVWDGTSWQEVSGQSVNLNPADAIGIQTTADSTNRFAVASPASLFTHATGDHRLKINKGAEADTAAVLYQSNYSGRAEIGLTGDDDFHFKVSPDGTNFHEAIIIDKDTGAVAFPNTTLSGTGGGSSGTQSPPAVTTTFADRPDPTSYAGKPVILITDERNGAIACYSDGAIWRRCSDDRVAQSATPDFYVDSIAGNDTRSGTSSSQSIKTLNQLVALIAVRPIHLRSGLVVALKRGSHWRENVIATAEMAGLIVTAYGALSDPAPMIDCADILANSAFGATAGTTNVYEITHTVETDTRAAEQPGIWVDGQRLSYVGSISACDAKPGTFHVPNASDQASITIHVHPPGSTAPDTDGKIYEATTRKAGVWLYDTPFAEVEDVHARRNHCSYGSICLGRYNRARRCRTSDGNSHNLFMRAFSEVENHLADGWDGLGGAATAYIGFDTATGGDGAPASDVWLRLKNCSARQTAQTRVAPAAITAISQATQAVVTAPGHGFANNEFVTISGVTGMTELNNRTFLISSVTTDTFKIKVASFDHGGSSFVNSTGYGAFLSGGDARLAYWMDGGAGSIGFFFHTDGTVTFDSIDIEGCDTIGCSLPFSGDNTRQMTLTNVSARQFKTGVKTLADRTVFRGLEGNVSFMNRPAIPGATLFTADRADQTIEMDGISAVLNSTGTIRSTYPGTTLRFRRGRLTGFNVLFRGDAANQTWDIQEMTNDPNGKGYTVYRFTAGATNLSLISDFNDFGGALDGSEDFVIDNVNLGSLDAYRIATGNDWNSKP